jgi:diguanylate cyclase (GGDEF)-like protein
VNESSPTVGTGGRSRTRPGWPTPTTYLSGLANRRALLADLEDALAADGPIGLALIDLDRFKTVNDTHGHAAGDHVLQVVATRLREVMTPGCLVARLGGDEFAVLTFDDDPGTLPVLASRVRGALARPVPVGPPRAELTEPPVRPRSG